MNLQFDIREVRGERSQETFAAQLGVNRTTVADWERGAAIPNWKHARRLVELGVPREHFLPTTTAANTKEVAE